MKFVREDDLPVGMGWAAARGDLGGCCLFVKASACRGGKLPPDALYAIRRLAYSSANRFPAASNA